jgi:hypothetical protein
VNEPDDLEPFPFDGDLEAPADRRGADSARADGAQPSLAYQGTILQFAAGSRLGIVRTASGREIPFDLEHVTVLGGLLGKPGHVALVNGQAVGYDVGWTSRGLRVTKLFPPG